MDNLILGEHTRPQAALVDQDAGLAVTVRWREPELMQYVVLWSRQGEGFYCIEPWMGLPDAIATGFGLKWLEPGQELALGFTIALEDRNV